jgi:serine/threonine protein kinase
VTGACLDDNDAAEFASGAMSGAAVTKVEKHLAGCRDCRALVAALAPTDGDADSDVVTAPRPARLPRGKKKRDVGLEPTLPRSPLEPEITVGDTIDRYVILARLGAGGMGVVWTAYDPQLDRKVAIKLLRAGKGIESSEGRARLVREAQAIAQLSHPNVVAVYDVGTADSGEVYIAMEFVEGETLTAWLAKWERTWRESLDVFLQAGRGLAAAHAVGLLHRDFKPDNVLVGTDARVRVTDFGLARSLITTTTEDARKTPTPALAALRVTLTATGTVLGTPRYMPPEQVRGRDSDARSDQFSFCVAMYEALYGRHPLPGDTAIDMVESGARAQPAPDGAIPASIGKALARGLEAEPNRRWPSMQALLHELTPPPVRTRERWLVAGIGGLLAIGAAGAAVLATGGSSQPAPYSPGERDHLLDRIKALESEREALLKDIERYKNDAGKLVEVQAKLAQRDQEIQQLVEKIREVTTDGGAPQVHHPAPPPVPAGGVTLAQARAALAPVDVRGCLGEWADRAGSDELSVHATLLVTPDGHAHMVELTGTDDQALSICLKGRLTAPVFPETPMETTIGIDVRSAAGRVALSAHVDAVRSGADEIDPNDLAPH